MCPPNISAVCYTNIARRLRALAVSAGSKLRHPLVKQTKFTFDTVRLVENNYEPSSFHSLPPIPRPNRV